MSFALVSGHPRGAARWHALLPGRVWSRTEPLAADGVRVVFSGRLFRGARLPAGLGLPADASPARIVAALWAAGGAGALDALRGHFVVAVGDGDRVTVRHDDSGMERVWWAELGGSGAAVLATDVRDVLDRVGAAVDEAALAEYLLFGYVGSARSLFRDVRRLPCFERLVWRDGAWRVDRVGLRRVTERRADDATSFRDAVGGLEAVLRDAVAVACAGETAVVNTLSGGVDSSYLQVLLGGLGHRTSASVAIAGAEHHHVQATAVAARLGARHRCHTIAADEFVDALVRGVETVATPEVYGGEAASLWLYERIRAERGAACVVSGDHADKLLGDGHPLLVGSLYDRGLPPALLDRVVGAYFGRRWPEYRRFSALWSADRVDAELLMRLWGERMRAERVGARVGRERVTAAYAHRVAIANETAGGIDEKLWTARVVASDERARSLWVKHALARAAGVSLVEPFSDPSVLLFLRGVPTRVKLRGLREKALERRLLEGALPRRLVRRPKLSNATPYRALVASSPRLRGLLAELREADYGDVLPDARAHVGWCLQQAEARDEIDGDLLYALTFHVWHRRWIAGGSHDARASAPAAT